MSQKTIKKNRKEIRRVVNRNFGQGLEMLSKVVRSRPKWIPKGLWIYAYAPLFPKQYWPTIKETIK